MFLFLCQMSNIWVKFYFLDTFYFDPPIVAQKLFLAFWGSSFQTYSDTFDKNSDTFWKRNF